MVSEDLVRKVAGVARIELTNDEVGLFAKQFEDIISWFNELGEIDTKGVSPSFHPLKTENVFREDKVEKCLSPEESLSNTSHKEKGFFKGPRSV